MTWGEWREATANRTRNSSESDLDQPPPTRARGVGRFRRSSAATGSNRVGLGAKQGTQQQAMALEESVEMEEMEETSELVGGEIEVGVRVGIGG